jgi:CRISPR-associated protein Csc2
MTRHGEVTSRINEQDHVRPQVIFPAVVTARDLTQNLFLYVLNNVLRAKRYGAQTTRTGRVHNHIVAVALADGEIFSNLLFTQRLHDALQEKDVFHPPDPVNLEIALDTAGQLIPKLLKEEGVVVDQLITGDELEKFLSDLNAINEEQESVTQFLSDAFDDSHAYHQAWVAKK